MKKTELQSIIREEIEKTLGKKNILSEATKYTWDVTQHKLHKWSLGQSKRTHGVPGTGGNYREVEWKKGQTVTVKAKTSLEAAQLALAEIWGVDSNSKPYEWPKNRDVEDLEVSVKKR